MNRVQPHADAPGGAAWQLLRRAARFWRAALVVFGLVAVGTAAVAVFTPQTYQSETVLYYRQGGRQAFGDVETSRRLGSRLQDMVMSRDRLAAIVREVNVYPRLPSADVAVEEMRKHVAFKAREGATFAITFDGEVPAVVQKVTQRLADTLIDDDRRLRSVDFEATKRLLDEERVRLSAEVQSRQAALQDLLRKNPGLAPPEPVGLDATGLPAVDLERQLADLEARRSAMGLGSSSQGARAAPDARTEAIAVLKRAQDVVEQEQKAFDEARRVYAEQHPSHGVAKARFAQAVAELERAKRGVQASEPRARAGDPSAIDRSIADVSTQLDRARRPRVVGGVARRSPALMALEVQRQTMQQSLDDARERLADLENKRFQTSVQAGLEANGDAAPLSVLSSAFLPAVPLTNAKKKVALLGLSAAVLLALGAAVLRGWLDDRVFDADDVLHLTSRPTLVVVPRLPQKKANVHV